VNSQRLGITAAVALTAALALSSCASNEGGTTANTTSPSNLSGTLNGIGSSAQGTAQTNWISGFQTANPKVTVNYDPQGSGAGRKAFIAGGAAFAGSDAALSTTELTGTFAGCAAGSAGIDLPVYISPIAIAYNLDGVTGLKLDSDTIAGIFSGAITTWNDPKIAALNSGTTLPGAPITVIHRSDDSGTTQNFTDYLATNSPTVWAKNGTPVPAGQTFPFQVGDAAKGTSGVADGVKTTKNSITYIDESGATGLSLAQLKVGSSFVTLSAAGAAGVVAASPLASGRAANDIAININRKDTSANAWPLVLVSYVVACQQYKDAATGDLVRAYVSYAVSDAAQQLAAQKAGSAPLAKDLATKVLAAAATIK